MPELQRTFTSMRQVRELMFIALLFLVSLGLLVFLTYQGMFILGAIRAYANGESHWSKGQKDAFFHLALYAYSEDRGEYENFKSTLTVPLAARRARLEMERADPDLEVVYENLIAAKNDPGDVEDMARLYLRYRDLPYMAAAINAWTQGDILIARLLDLGQRLDSAYETGEAGSEFMAQFWTDFVFLREHFERAEGGFTGMLAEGGRTTRTLLMRVVSVTALLLLVIGVFFSGWIIRRIKESEGKYRRLIENATDAIFVTDVKTGRIIEANPKAVELTGLPLPEILGSPHREIDDGFGGGGRFRSAGDGRSPAGLPMKERAMRSSDGRLIPVDVTTSELEINGRRVIQSIYRDITLRKEFEDKLHRLNEMLEKRVAERTAEAEERARQLEVLAIELTHAEQRERRRLAQSLHDNLQQLLIAARMRVESLLPVPAEPNVQRIYEELSNLLKSAVDASRSLTVELSPPILYDAGFPAGIEWLGRRMKETYGLSIKLDVLRPVEPIPNDLRAFLFQAVRELLFNIVKYAQVDWAEVILNRQVEGHREMVAVTVRDEGIGFSAGEQAAAIAETGGFGLFSIRERLDLLGGWMTIDSAKNGENHGTRVVLCVPLARNEGEERASPSEKLRTND